MSQSFDSPLAFALHLAERAIAIDAAAHIALDRAASIIEGAAKDEIGTYQSAVGSFPAWAELADNTKQDRINKGYSENDPLLRSGELRDSISHKADGLEAIIGSNSDIAVYQELGTGRIPPRPFMGPAAIRSRVKVERILGEAIVGAMLYGGVGHMTRLEGNNGKIGPEGSKP